MSPTAGSPPHDEPVSVVIPLFDRAAMIGEAIASALAQTHAPIEVVVCDDGSGDGGGEVVRDLASRHPTIRLVTQDNAGPSAARNTALRGVRTRLVTFLDSDDLMAPDRVAEQVAVLADPAAEADLIIGLEDIQVSDGIAVPRWVRELPPAEVAPRWYTMSMLLDRTWLDRVGGFDESVRIGEDIDLLVRLRAAGARVGLLDQVVVTRRITGDNLIYDEDEVSTSMVHAMHRHLRARRDGVAQ